jgi:hypothetical protein
MDVTEACEHTLPTAGGRERRRDARLAMARPVKLQCMQTGRYLAAQTQNLSSGGALLEIDQPSLLVAGQRLRVGVAWTSRQTVLHRDELAEATVVRSLAIGPRQSVAVCFDHRQELAVTG